MSGSRQGFGQGLDHDAVNGERDERTTTTERRTPLRRPSPPLLQPSRPGSASRSATTTSNPRDGILRRLSYDDLTRDGSNPRTRTPLRYESPLNPPDRNGTTTTTTTASAAVASLRTTREGQRVTVRPLAGTAVGTTIGPRRLQEAHQIQNRSIATSHHSNRSSKQGPSHHKVRRWNNDNFVGVASDLARHSKPGVAENLLRAQADAPLYQSIYPTSLSGPTRLTTLLLQDESLESLRHQFANGEIGHARGGGSSSASTTSSSSSSEDPSNLMKRIHDRLRHVLIRACAGSDATIDVVNALEECLKNCFLWNEEEKETSTTTTLTNPQARLHLAVIDTLLEPPLVTRRALSSSSLSSSSSSHCMARFYFDATSSTGGFHRLLLHAICQFHGLHATSTTTTTTNMTNTTNTANTDAVGLSELKTGGKEARLLTVTGKRMLGPDVRITDCLHLDVGVKSSERATHARPSGRMKGATAATTTNATSTIKA